MLVPLRVTIAGETHDVDAGPLELVQFEREYDVAAPSMADNARVEWLCYLAYRAMRNKRLYDQGFDEFLAEVTAVEAREQPATVDPTNADPHTG